MQNTVQSCSQVGVAYNNDNYISLELLPPAEEAHNSQGFKVTLT